MKAGRELDALVAEKVMGLKVITISDTTLKRIEYALDALKAVGYV